MVWFNPVQCKLRLWSEWPSRIVMNSSTLERDAPGQTNPNIKKLNYD
jgi:hypothetical protein